MARTIRRGKKRITIGVIALLTVAGAGAAFAYWTSTGSGTGAATTGESVAFTITSETAVGTIAPGNAGQTVDFTVTNPGEGSQYLTTVTVALATAAGVPWVPAGDCSIDDYVATISTAPPAGQIAAGASVDGTATVTLTNTAENQNDCQGQTVPLYFEAS
ncbi:hypothetical protein N1027_16715 [Herbiconiux sp. CPCC 205763]|uniref:Ribosomally synthesized peptide with SipW-like signal peptide n=1 Tax=Herbiconiux aconitum TaxID=2970913 RepID=A0ABT2GUE7_9MICO|nr:hypothetical protein [Herbiconiux aconitum]MCS5719778.1 hypothetical protein [Herbiconiux aconitum]